MYRPASFEAQNLYWPSAEDDRGSYSKVSRPFGCTVRSADHSRKELQLCFETLIEVVAMSMSYFDLLRC